MYNPQTTVMRIKELSDSKSIKQKELNERCGLNKNTINSSANSKMGLNAKALFDISNILNCSTDYLLGRTDKSDMTITVNQTGEVIESSPINAINNSGQYSSEMTAELVKMFESMDFSNKMKVMNYVIDLKAKE